MSSRMEFSGARPRQRRSVVIAAIASGSLLLGLTGCIAAKSPVGAAAVYLDDAGQISIVVEACGDPVTKVELRRVDVSADGATVGEWTPARSSATPDFAIHNPPTAWNVDLAPPRELDGLGTYSAGADTEDYLAAAGEFTLTSLKKLGPGQVRYLDGKVVDRRDFAETVC